MTAAGRTSIFAAGAVALMLLGAAAAPGLVWAAVFMDGLILAMILIQGRRLSAQPVTLTREGWGRMTLHRMEPMVYRVENKGERDLLISIRQPLPQGLVAQEDTLRLLVAAGEAVEVALDVTPTIRGAAIVPPALVDVKSPGLEWAVWRQAMGGQADLTIYPDTRALAEYDILRHHRALGRYGVRRIRQIGAGWEFEQLREYARDDDYRNINWKATARRRKPITNVFQAEKSQSVMLCVENGRMMGAPQGDGSALDRAVDACVMLAHVANRTGDRVGLTVFKDTVDLFLKPKKGAAATNQIVERLAHLAPEGVFPSYSALVDALRARNKARSMIFLFTDVNDPKLAEDLLRSLPLISGAHVVVVVSLRDPLLGQRARGGAQDMAGVYRALAARKLLNERQGRLSDLRKRGVQVLEADAGELSLAVINRYLTIKKRQLL